MPRIAFLTMDSLEGFVSYDNLVRDILQERGVIVDEVSWRARNVSWDEYDLVIIRSPWDYQQSCDEFLAVLKRIDGSRATLLNPLNIVSWNVRKTYLQSLEEQGITIVPTIFLTDPTTAQLRGLFERFQSQEIVIKPVVGAGACDTFRLRPDTSEQTLDEIQQLYRNRTALVQPFVESVVSYGEVSLIFFGGEYCHSVLKTPKPRDFRVQEEHGGIIQRIYPEPAVVQFAQHSLSVVQTELLYARVDLVFLPDNKPAIMEMELIEPSLYLSYAAESPARFADAIESQLFRIMTSSESP